MKSSKSGTAKAEASSGRQTTTPDNAALMPNCKKTVHLHLGSGPGLLLFTRKLIHTNRKHLNISHVAPRRSRPHSAATTDKIVVGVGGFFISATISI